VQNQRNIRVTIPSSIGKLLKDLSDRQIDLHVFTMLIDYMMESVLLAPEKSNIIKVISALLKSNITKDSKYFVEGVL
jgi:hypothetical protein